MVRNHKRETDSNNGTESTTYVAFQSHTFWQATITVALTVFRSRRGFVGSSLVAVELVAIRFALVLFIRLHSLAPITLVL